MLETLQKKFKFVLALLIVIIFLLTFFISDKGSVEPAKAAVLEKEESKVLEIYKVDIKGSVVNPGVYEVLVTDRIIDVINKAGGLTEDADTSNINLSKRIKDEMVIVISNTENINEEVSISEEVSIGSNNDSNLISLNDASMEELLSLSGIGKSKAEAIIKYREEQRFNSIDEIKNVNGIGDSIFEKIKDYITV